MADEQEFSSIPAFADLERARENAQTAKTLLEEASQDVLQAIYTIAIQTEDNIPLRYAIIQYLYWEEDVNPTTLAEVFGLQRNEVAKIASKDYGVYLHCESCGKKWFYPITSRTHWEQWKRSRRRAMPEWMRAAGYKRDLCTECELKEKADSDQRHKEWVRQREARFNDLRTMPYREYLQTPEWQQRRAEHLKRARYRCQVCNAGNTQLNVHHRTYERRGNENIRDLIVLCRNCHEIFHQQGKLQD